jgi:hypothetical protein
MNWLQKLKNKIFDTDYILYRNLNWEYRAVRVKQVAGVWITDGADYKRALNMAGHVESGKSSREPCIWLPLTTKLAAYQQMHPDYQNEQEESL